jgi:hypothetical protein
MIDWWSLVLFVCSFLTVVAAVVWVRGLSAQPIQPQPIPPLPLPRLLERKSLRFIESDSKPDVAGPLPEAMMHMTLKLRACQQGCGGGHTTHCRTDTELGAAAMLERGAAKILADAERIESAEMVAREAHYLLSMFHAGGIAENFDLATAGEAEEQIASVRDSEARLREKVAAWGAGR